MADAPLAPPPIFGRPLLVLEASCASGSVAVVADGQCVGAVDVQMGVGRADHLFPAAQALLKQLGLSLPELGGVVCGAGPGSFTSLRIAASLAKGLAHGAERPLYAVSSLMLAAADALGQMGAQVPVEPFVVHSDALRGERYVQSVTITSTGHVAAVDSVQRMSQEQLEHTVHAAMRYAVQSSPSTSPDAGIVLPRAGLLYRVEAAQWNTPVALDAWEPAYGRLAEAQVKWEAAHGTSLAGARTT